MDQNQPHPSIATVFMSKHSEEGAKVLEVMKQRLAEKVCAAVPVCVVT